MKTSIGITIQTRTFPVTLRDNRSGETIEGTLTLAKEQLQAAALVGMDNKELIRRIYNQEGYKVLEIGTPVKREIMVDPENGRAVNADT